VKKLFPQIVTTWFLSKDIVWLAHTLCRGAAQAESENPSMATPQAGNRPLSARDPKLQATGPTCESRPALSTALARSTFKSGITDH